MKKRTDLTHVVRCDAEGGGVRELVARTATVGGDNFRAERVFVIESGTASIKAPGNFGSKALIEAQHAAMHPAKRKGR